MPLRVEERKTDALIDIRTCLLAGVAIINGFGGWIDVDKRIEGKFFSVEFLFFGFYFFFFLFHSEKIR